jgi:NAD(P)-dependent dehydrogenase (short-subunit alcohol dehydrogenase family)
MGDALPLAGRVALVTGASRGIGRAISLAMGRAGATVACAARSLDQVEVAAAAIEAAGARALGLRLDVTRAEQITAAVEQAETRLTDRHPGQQRRWHAREEDGGADRRGVGHRGGDQSDIDVPLRPGGGAWHDPALAVYLASPAADFMIGQTLYLDGGQTIGW